jgi:hypothetical protein
MIPSHIKALSSLKEILSADGKQVSVWQLTLDKRVDLSAWSKHFRQQYCLDEEIDALRQGTGRSRSEYLNQICFPDGTAKPGPSIRAADFAELIVTDFVEYVLDYWVPRGKYAEKAVRNESVKGVDILGFKMTPGAGPLPTDTLITYEVKAQLSGQAYRGGLQAAINDSGKDYLRMAESLNALKRRLLALRKQDDVLKVERFQNRTDNPFVLRSGAAAVLTESAFDEAAIGTSTQTAGHTNQTNLELTIVKGVDLMDLTTALYQQASDEA